MRDLKQLAINVLRGVHLGDALGVPFEMMAREEILSLTGGGVNGPRFDLDPAARKLADTRGLAPGSTSDDSQLTDATSCALALSGGPYVHELHVLLHLEALRASVSGWGGTTKRSLYELDKWYRARNARFGKGSPAFLKGKDRRLWEEAEERDPNHPARWREKARGNGPAMKIAPFGIRSGLRGGGDLDSGEALEEILQFSRITHADPVCAVAAYAVACVIADSMAHDPDEAAKRLLERVELAESRYVFLHRGPDRFSVALVQALKLMDEPEKLWAFGSAGIADALTTVPMAIAIWWRHLADFGPQPAVLEAINAGGDTDTVAAMVGAMMGAADDRGAWWPTDWVSTLADRGARSAADGKSLFEVITRVRPPYGYDLERQKRLLDY